MKVLLYAANPETHRALTEVLTRRGHETTAVEDADSICEACRPGDHPLAVFDVDSPDGVGASLCRRVRELAHGGRCMILALTGRTDPTQLGELLGWGFDDYLPDPLSDGKLTELRLEVAERRLFDAGLCWLAFQTGQRPVAERCALANDVPFGVFHFTREGRFLVVNQALVKMLGYDSEAELLAVDLPGDVYHDPNAYQRLIAEAQQHVEGLELQWKRKDGTPIMVRMSCHAVRDQGGGLTGFEGIIEDISSQKRLERELERSFSLSLEMVCIAGTDGYFKRVNPAFETTLGYSREELLSRPFSELVHPEDREATLAEVDKLSKGIPTVRFENRYRCKDGSYRWLAWTAVPQEQEGLIFAAGRDVTERKRAEAEIQRNLDIQSAISSVLRISLEALSLKDQLERTLDLLFSIPWIALESKGCIFLVEGDPQMLVMKAQRGLPEDLLAPCSRVPVGKCLCGRAAADRQIVFADGLDARHETRYSGISPHGHYCVPIASGGRLHGVINVYVREGHQRNPTEEMFLSAVAHALAGTIERKGAEEALRQSEQRYRELLAAVTTYTYSVKIEDGVPVSTQHGWGCVSVTGRAPEEYAADPYLWISMVHPDDREMVRRHVARVLEGQRVPPIEHRVVHRDGTTRWVRDTIVPHYDQTGRFDRYDGLVEDVTERKRADEQFRHLFESAPDAMVIVDPSGTIVLVNAQAEESFGYSREELLGQPVEILIPERFREKHVQQRAGYVANPYRRPLRAGPDFYALRKQGGEFPVEISLSPLETEEGVLVLCEVRDITERKRAERAIRENQARMLAAQRIQEHLLPDAPPELPGFDIAGAMFPAEFTAGDHFDYLKMPDRSIAVSIGDVSGHGFPSALLMASTHAHIHSLTNTYTDVGEILRFANAVLVEETEEDRFVTLLLGRLDPQSRSFVYASAGHPTGYVLDSSGEVKARLESTSFPLSIVPDAEFPTGVPVELQPGDIVLLLTDGILEARSPEGAQFGDQRTLEIVRASRNGSARQIIETLYAAVRAFSGGAEPEDDLTVVVIKVEPTS